MKSNSEARLEAAKNAIQRLKSLRHPNVLQFINAAEMPDKLYIVTEACEPLDLKAVGGDTPEAESYLALGLHQLFSTVSFLNNDCQVVHGNICPSSIFITKSGDWKLGGFDLAWSYKEGIPYLVKNNSHVVPDEYRPPSKSWMEVERAPSWATDAWMLGCLVYAVFNNNFRSQEQLGNIGNIPELLRVAYGKLLATSPDKRLNAKEALKSPFFSNPLVESVEFLDKLVLKSVEEKVVFFMSFAKSVGELRSHPLQERVLKYKILPALTKAMEFGGAEQAFSHVLSASLQIGALLNEEDFTVMVAPSVRKLFASNQRGVRIQLLQNLDAYATNLTGSVVNEIWPNLKTGFSDKTPQLRELTLKALVAFVPKLDPTIVDTEVMKFLAKLQKDPQASIRTNTTYCLGKIAPSLRPETQQRVLASAYTRALQDPFPPSRIAGIACLSSSAGMFPGPTVANVVVPAISGRCIDPEKDVRTAALRALSVFCHRLQSISNEMPTHPKSAEELAAEQQSGTKVAKAAGMIGKVGNWAVSSLSKKLYGGEDEKGQKLPASVGQQQATDAKSASSTATQSQSQPNTTTQASRGANPSSSTGSSAMRLSNNTSTPSGQTSGPGSRGTSAAATSGGGWDDDFMDFDDDDDKDDDDGFGSLSMLSTTKKAPVAQSKKAPVRKASRPAPASKATRASKPVVSSKSSADDPFSLLSATPSSNDPLAAMSFSNPTAPSQKKSTVPNSDWDSWNDLDTITSAPSNSNAPSSGGSGLLGVGNDEDPFSDLAPATTNKMGANSADDDWGSLLGTQPAAAAPKQKKGDDDWTNFLNS